MLNFTTTTIINAAQNASGAAILPADLFKGAVATGLYVKNVGSFKSAEMVSMTKKAYAAESPATVTLDFSSATTTSTDDIYRLSIDIELYKSESSLYARPWPTKGKPIYVEALGGTDLAATLASNASKYMNLVYDTEILTVAKAAAGKVTVTAKEGSQILKSVILEKWVKDTNAGDSYAGGKWQLVKATTAPVKGNPGFGTYEHLIHNVVLPTYENMRYGNAVANAPKLGGKYNQYVITKRVERDALGTGAVGQVLVSETQHVFWVETSIASSFESQFGMPAEDTTGDIYETVSILED